MLIVSLVVDDRVPVSRLRDVWGKVYRATFNDAADCDIIRGETCLKGIMMKLVRLIQDAMVKTMLANCNGVLSISMDESNKKNNDRMIITLSYASALGRVTYDCVGAVPVLSKKADECYEHTIKKTLLEFDPSGAILDILNNRGTGMVDHAPAAMKLIRLVVKHPYDCDAHGVDLVMSTVSEAVVGTQDGLGSLRVYQFLYELGFSARKERGMWNYILEHAQCVDLPPCATKLIKMMCQARWGCAGVCAAQYIELATVKANQSLIDYACEKLPDSTPESLSSVLNITGKHRRSIHTVY
jgi:hypothetical protein